MLHLLRTEFYRHPRRMTVLVSFAVLFVMGAVNIFGFFSSMRQSQEFYYKHHLEMGITELAYRSEMDYNWHLRFSELFSNYAHMIIFSLLMVTLPLSFDLMAQRNDELTAAGYSPGRIFAAKTLAAIPTALGCYLFVLAVNFFTPYRLIAGLISGKEWLVMLKIAAVSASQFVCFCLVGAGVAFFVRRPLVSFFVNFGLGIVLRPHIILRHWFADQQFYRFFDSLDGNAMISLFGQDPGFPDCWADGGRYLVAATLLLLAIGLLIWTAGLIANNIREKRR